MTTQNGYPNAHGAALDESQGPSPYMVTAPGSCVKWPLPWGREMANTGRL